MRHSVYLAVLLAASVLPAAAQSLGSVEGRVVNSATGEGVKKAVVTVNSIASPHAGQSQGQSGAMGVFISGVYSGVMGPGMNGPQVYNAVTDASGKFHIDNVPSGLVTAMAMAEGYNMMRGQPIQPVQLDAGQQLTGIEIKLAPLSVISGKVTDEDGEPVVGAQVTALRYWYGMGQAQLQQNNSTTTDDRGQYRMFDIQPGRIYLSASSNGNAVRRNSAPNVHSDIPEEAYARVFYPGVSDMDQAAPHNLKPGEDWTGADFKLRKLPLFHVRGRVDSSALPAGQRATVQAESCSLSGRLVPFFMPATNRQDGTFDLMLTSGEWCLVIREQARGANGVALERPIEVKDSNIDGLTLAPPPAFTVNGSISIDGTPPQHMPRLGITLRPADVSGQQAANVKDDLTFQIDNVFPGKHYLFLPQAGGLYVKSILYSGQDVSSGVIPDLEPGGSLAITLGTDWGEVDAQVQSGSLSSGSPVLISIMPDDAHIDRLDLYRINGGNADGKVSLGGLAPGEYKVLAFEGQDYEDAQNHELLRALASRAAAVTVHANGHDQVTLTPVSAAEIEKAKEKLP